MQHSFNIKHIKTSHLFSSSLGILFLIILTFFLSCPAMEAEATDSFSTDVHSNATAYVRSTISVALTSEINFDLTPKASGSFSKGEALLTVATNNTTGYAVYLKTRDDSQNLTPVNSEVKQVIGAINGTMTEADYQDNLNTWGYALGKSDGATYKALPKSGDPAIITTEKTSSSDQYNLSFGVAIGNDLPAGLYTNQVIASVVANPIEVRGINDLTFMQEMTPEICLVSFENETKQLIDQRDNKSYWVAKLKDGNCWMVQNLALDLDVDKTFTSDDTDLIAGTTYTPSSSTNDVLLTGTATDEAEIPRDTQYSWKFTNDPVLGTPADKYVGCNMTNLSSTFKTCSGGSFGAKITTDATWQPTFTAQDGSMELDNGTEYQGWVAIDTTNNTYDAHYLFGNYYQYNAATAGTGMTGTTTLVAQSSICPKGWTLPTGGKNSYMKNGSIGYLLQQYGLMEADGTGVVEFGNYNIAKPPLYFVKAGSINLLRGIMPGVGNDIRLWGNASIYVKSSYKDDTITANDFAYSFLGFNVRCVAK